MAQVRVFPDEDSLGASLADEIVEGMDAARSLDVRGPGPKRAWC